VAFREGRALAYQGDPVRRAFLILEGTVRLTVVRSDDSTLDLGVEEAGAWVGLAELTLGGPALADALAGPGCRVLAVDAQTFARWKRDPAAGDWLAAALARKVYALQARVEVGRPGVRLARWLADRGPVVTATQEDLAAAVGTTRETVNRTLGRLQTAGLVAVDRGAVKVTDGPGLRAWGG